MKLKKVLTLLPLLATTALVASCGNNSSSSSSASKPSTSSTTPSTSSTTKPTSSSSSSSGDNGGLDLSSVVDENGVITVPTTVTLWSTTGKATQPALEKYIEEFKSAQPNVTVTNEYVSGSYSDLENKVVTGFSSNNYPDLVVAYPDHVADYLDYGKAVDLSAFILNDYVGLTEEDANDYVDSFMSEGMNYTQTGMYSVPWCKSTELMFYNETLIGVDLSAYDAAINNGNALDADYLNSLTWEELFNKLCPALEKYNTANNNSLYDPETGGILGYDSDDNLFITLAEQYGYNYTSVNKVTGKGSVDFNNPEMKALMTTFHNAATKKYIFTKGTNNGNYVNTVFTEGKCVFSIGSTGGVKYQFSDTNPMNIGTARIPHAEGKDPKVILQGPSMAVLDHNNLAQKTAAWLLWKTLTSEDNALDWALESGYMPVRKSSYEDQEYIDACDYTACAPRTVDRLKAKAYSACAEVLTDTFTSPVFIGSSATRSAVGGLVTQCLIKDSWSLTGSELDSYIDGKFADAENTAKLAIK